MVVRQPRYSKKEFAQRGDRWYETQIRQQVEVGNYGKIVAIDIETKERAKRCRRLKYEAILAKVPDVEPEPYDRIPIV
jgi:hypothetical protein